MCGICGYVNIDKGSAAEEDILKRMCGALVHRGPDDEGIYIKDNIALGHRRLSIIDLALGHQPIFNEDSSVAVIHNGEIYNFPELKENLSKKGHLFKTRSDTETIVHAYEEYGEDCVRYIDGMFAFAIWDSRKKTLFLARDRFGKKPLYYGLFGGHFIFSSELKAMLKHPAVRKEIDLRALSKYLAYEYIPAPYSIFKNIYKLKAGSRLTLPTDGKGRLTAGDIARRTDSYWDIDFGAKSAWDIKNAEKRLIELLRESVRRRLISDVPLGVFLSGGIDSSAVVAMMAELMKPRDIKTFSIGFREKQFDESGDARRVADHFGTDHREEILEPDVMLEVFDDIAGILDEPFADSSIIPTYLVSRFTRRYVKVALGGDGGDELFQGYPSFTAHRLNRYSPLLRPAAGPLSMALNNMAAGSYNYTSFAGRAERFLRGLGFADEIRHQVWTGSFVPEEEKGLFLPGSGLSFDPLDVYDITRDLYGKMKDADPLDRASYIYVKTYMTDDILAKVDRASMANSLEVRAPFLDTKFAEFCASLPNNFKTRNFKTKWILKEALKGRLPDETLNKPKRGFAVPVAKWLKGDLRHMLETAFDKKKIEKEGIFDYNYMAGLKEEFLADKRDRRKEVWALFMFENWYDRWM